MGDWDPYADADAPSGTGFSGGGALETITLEGSTAKIAKKDFDRVLEQVWKKFGAEAPWQTAPDPAPDLSWHVPTCTFEDWKHTDVKVALGEAIVYITLNRPAENNAVNASMLGALCDALFLLHQRKDIRVAVFMGEGKMLCVGGDIAGSFKTDAASAEVKATLAAMSERALKGGAFPNGTANIGELLVAKMWHTWATLPQFTICLANGSAIAEGLGVVIACDFAISVRGAFFEVSEVKKGLAPANLAPYIVAKTGTGVAKRIFCTSENMSAEAAKEAKIINEVVDNLQEGHKKIKELCASLTRCGPRTVEAAKLMVHGVAGIAVSEPLMFYTSSVLAHIQGAKEYKDCAALKEGDRKPWELTPIKPLY